MTLVKLKVNYIDDQGKHPVGAEVEIDQAYLDRHPWVGDVVTETTVPAFSEPELSEPVIVPAVGPHSERHTSPTPKRGRGGKR